MEEVAIWIDIENGTYGLLNTLRAVLIPNDDWAMNELDAMSDGGRRLLAQVAGREVKYGLSGGRQDSLP